MPHRILLVREWDAQTAASGCCGRLGGVNHELGEAHTYAHVRQPHGGHGARSTAPSAPSGRPTRWRSASSIRAT